MRIRRLNIFLATTAAGLASCTHIQPSAQVAIYNEKSLIPASCSELTAIEAFDGLITSKRYRIGTESRALKKLQKEAVGIGGNALFVAPDSKEEILGICGVGGLEVHLHGIALQCTPSTVLPSNETADPRVVSPMPNTSLERTHER